METARRDLEGLVDAGVLLAIGEKRRRIYWAGDELQET